DNLISIITCLLGLGTLFLNQNYILSFIALLSISGSLLVLIFENDLYGLMHVYVALYSIGLTCILLNEAKLIASSKKLSKLYNPLRIGFIFSLLFGLFCIGKKNLLTEDFSPWFSSIVMIPITLYLISQIIKILDVKLTKSKNIIYYLSVLILTSTVFSPAISGALIIILLCFLVNYRTGFVIGIIATIYFISQYYYDLNLTLLTKSMILFGSGVVFLLLYFLITKKKNSHEKV
ncbi:MAG: DUF4401 domain-containing protein, partial [Flavobacteriaceae bacterium]|nr:DUF4401 domain-containing protein [Flavobacteriaceae bacterium]